MKRLLYYFIQGLLYTTPIAITIYLLWSTLSYLDDLIPLNLKKYAHIELLKENISNTNIDISNLCTYESNHNFHSWRRTKTFLRQWNFISS